MSFEIINPYNQDLIEVIEPISSIEMERKIQAAANSQLRWKALSLDFRIKAIKELKQKLLDEKEELARLASQTMGKPLVQSLAEIKKCALLMDYYLNNAANFISATDLKTEASLSRVYYQPLGVILGIMPWNFPYWQVFRFAIPTLLLGNTVMVKHAPNTMNIGRKIEALFSSLSISESIYTDLPIEVSQVEACIGNPHIKACSVTGSERAGKAVAELAGRNLKKCVLELGGSNAFVVVQDADLELALQTAVTARMQNNGQSCIAAKRFLIHESIYTDFIERFHEKLKPYKLENPIEPTTKLGPLARIDLAKNLHKQVAIAIAHGAKLVAGGKRNKAHFEATILKDVTTDNPIFFEEVFGPVALFTSFSSLNEAIALVNSSQYGLGVSFFTTSQQEKVIEACSILNEPAVFINEMVKSDPRIPFGGVKQSGYGRELGKEALVEFCNVQALYVK